MYQYEDDLRQKGFQRIAGCDEVGRGPLAGALVAAAVILDPNQIIEGLNDSKQLTDKKRRVLYDEIYQKALAVSTAIIDVSVIDQINVYKASQKALEDAVLTLCLKPDYVLIDAMKLSLPMPSLSLIKGDTLSASIAAASIVAKVTRDDMMIQAASSYPGYGFEKHKGYPTKQHLEALKTLGVTPIHRTSYAPIQALKQLKFKL